MIRQRVRVSVASFPIGVALPEESVLDPNCGAAEISRDRTYEFFDVRKKTAGFLIYHGFLTIASSSRIISLD
jgi:hypothetical protein